MIFLKTKGMPSDIEQMFYLLLPVNVKINMVISLCLVQRSCATNEESTKTMLKNINLRKGLSKIVTIKCKLISYEETFDGDGLIDRL